jgi:preprotein translocase subunit SecD
LQLTSGEEADGSYVEMRMTPAELKRRQDVAIEQNITTLRNRVDELGIAEPIVTRQAANRIVVQLPGVQDPNEAIRVLGRPRRWSSAWSTRQQPVRGREQQAHPDRLEALQGAQRPPDPPQARRHRDRRAAERRELLVPGRQPQVNVKLDSRGGQSMFNATKDNVGKRMAVVYISKKQLAQGEQCKGVRTGQICTEEEVISAARFKACCRRASASPACRQLKRASWRCCCGPARWPRRRRSSSSGRSVRASARTTSSAAGTRWASACC